LARPFRQHSSAAKLRWAAAYIICNFRMATSSDITTSRPYDLGFEAFVTDGTANAYLYDLASGHWFYTSPSLFPYLYDFSLNAWLYYFPNTNDPGHYTANPRYFVNLTTQKIFTM
jgi:hypothetical protein